MFKMVKAKSEANTNQFDIYCVKMIYIIYYTNYDKKDKNHIIAL